MARDNSMSDADMMDINDVSVGGFTNYVNTPARLGRMQTSPPQQDLNNIDSNGFSTYMNTPSRLGRMQVSPLQQGLNNINTNGFSTYINTPTRLGRTSGGSPSTPPQLAGQKRSRLDFEPDRPELRPTPRFTISNRRMEPGEVRKETHEKETVPAVRLIKSVGTCAHIAASFTGWGVIRTFQWIRDRFYTARGAKPSSSIIPTQDIGVIDVGHKRRAVSVMPGSYPNSPVKNDLKALSPAKISVPQEEPITVMVAQKAPEQVTKPETSSKSNIATGPTPPDSEESSSESSPASSPDSPPHVSPQRRPAPRVQPRNVRRSYRQPFSYEPFSASKVKPILKGTGKHRDTVIDHLITRGRKVIIESPEEKAVRHTYRRRKDEEEAREAQGLRDIIRNRTQEEERQEREAELKRRAEVRAARAGKDEERAQALVQREIEKVLRKQAADKRYKEMEKKVLKEAEDKKIKETEEEISRLQLADKQRQEDRLHEEAEEREKLASSIKAVKQPTTDDLITTLSSDLQDKIDKAMAVKNPTSSVVNTVEGAELSRKDFGTLLPQAGTNDSPSGWLNDEIVNGVMGAMTAAKKEKTNYQKGKGAPAYEYYPSSWYITYKNKGMQGLARWSGRKGIKGKALLGSEHLYFPVNEGSHWTLLIISPKTRTIEFLDSLPSVLRAQRMFAIAREWLAMELGTAYKADEWTDHHESVSQQQNNSNDCGVFTCFNALANAKGFPYDLVDPERIPEARRMLAAVLLKRGFNQDMEL